MKEDEAKYRCGHCSRNVTSRYLTGFERKSDSSYTITPPNLLSCPTCSKDSVLYTNSEKARPLPLLGDMVLYLPDDVDAAYTEARITFSACAYTACMLVCRNILAYAANKLGSGKKRTFVEYIDHLVEGGHITQAMKDWADDIRQHGNDAAHDLKLRDRNEAWDTLNLTKYLLQFMFEVEGERKKGPPNSISHDIVRGPGFGSFF